MPPDELAVCVTSGYMTLAVGNNWIEAEAIVYSWGGQTEQRFRKAARGGREKVATEARLRATVQAEAETWIEARS
jgi:hypothetical protein